MSDLMAQAAADWAANTDKHVLTVLHEEGLYRHLLYAQPDTDLYRVDLVTWPGGLAVSGDVHGYMFRCARDMIAFFRSAGADIQPGYWAEKVVDGRNRCQGWNAGLFTSRVAEVLAAAEATYPGIAAAWAEATEGFFIEHDVSTADGAREAVAEFWYYGEPGRGLRPWRFPADAFAWESFGDWDWHYLRSCHAVRATIAAYDAARVPVVPGGGS